MAWLNYHHLYYFSKIAEVGSVSEAAKQLRLGQPTLSSQLKALEEQLGELFERRNRRLVLTERGRLVLQYAQDIFSRGDELLRVVERGELAVQKHLTLGAQEGVPKSILAATVIRLSKLSGARVTVKEGEAGQLLEDVSSGHLDLLITDHQFTHHAGIAYLPVASERISVWRSASDSKPIAGKFPANLTDAPFVMPGAGHPLRMKLDNYFLEHSIVPKVVAEIPDTALVKELGVQGFGMIALGETTVRAWVRAGRLVSVGRLPIEMTYWLGVPRKSLKDPLLEGITKAFTKEKALQSI